MPTFDIVSEFDQHEVSNAVDQANREVGTRFDFKGSDSRFEQDEGKIIMRSQSDFQLQQMLDMLQNKLTKRGIDIACLQIDDPQIFGKDAHQTIILRQGLEAPLAKKIVKQIKDRKLKVQASIQGEKIRVSGKKRDDLQQVIALLREGENEMPLQFENFRD